MTEVNACQSWCSWRRPQSFCRHKMSNFWVNISIFVPGLKNVCSFFSSSPRSAVVTVLRPLSSGRRCVAAATWWWWILFDRWGATTKRLRLAFFVSSYVRLFQGHAKYSYSKLLLTRFSRTFPVLRWHSANLRSSCIRWHLKARLSGRGLGRGYCYSMLFLLAEAILLGGRELWIPVSGLREALEFAEVQSLMSN